MVLLLVWWWWSGAGYGPGHDGPLGLVSGDFFCRTFGVVGGRILRLGFWGVERNLFVGRSNFVRDCILWRGFGIGSGASFGSWYGFFPLRSRAICFFGALFEGGLGIALSGGRWIGLSAELYSYSGLRKITGASLLCASVASVVVGMEAVVGLVLGVVGRDLVVLAVAVRVPIAPPSVGPSLGTQHARIPV